MYEYDDDIVGAEDGFYVNVEDEAYCHFISTPGALINTGEGNDAYPTVYENLGLFSLNDLEENIPGTFDYGDTTDFDEGRVSGAIIKHVFTGHIYATVPDCRLKPVVDFDYNNGSYSNIRFDRVGEKDWRQVPTNFEGIRVGGHTAYDKNSWPHFEDTPLKFLAQYLLPNGKYIHMFFDWESDNSPEMEGGENCAIVEGGPVPSWITLKPLEIDDSDFVEFPNFAFTPVPAKSGILPTPYWVQGEAIPNDPRYRFLMQFGYSTIPNYDYYSDNTEFHDLMMGDSGDWYLFYNPQTEEARILAQFS